MILSFTQALSHGFMSFMASEWIWVILRFWVHAVKEKLFRVCLTHRKPCGVVSPTAINLQLQGKKMWYVFCLFVCFALKLLVPTSVLSTVGGYHYIPVALTGDISQCLKEPRISNSKCISPNLASHFITTFAWLRENNKFRTGLVLAKSWCATPILPLPHKWWLLSPSPSSDCHSLNWSWHPILLFPLRAPHFLCVIRDSNSSPSPGGGWETYHGDESVYWQQRDT